MSNNNASDISMSNANSSAGPQPDSDGVNVPAPASYQNNSANPQGMEIDEDNSQNTSPLYSLPNYGTKRPHILHSSTMATPVNLDELF